MKATTIAPELYAMGYILDLTYFDFGDITICVGVTTRAMTLRALANLADR